MRHTFRVLSNKELPLPLGLFFLSIVYLSIKCRKVASVAGRVEKTELNSACLCFVEFQCFCCLQASGVFRLLISTALCVKQRSQKALY